MERTRQRQITLLWCMIAAAVLPLLWFLPLEQLGALSPVRLNQIFVSPFLPPVAATLVLAWAWRTRALRF
jgi:hypothetical protein